MTPAIHLLCRYLSQRDTLTDEEREILISLPQRASYYAKGAEIVAEGSRPKASCLMQAGWSGRAVHRRNGARQLTALHIAGDFVDLHGLVLKQMDHSVIALSDCTVVFVAHDALRQISEKAPHLARLLWLSTTIDAAIQRKMTALLGRHTPTERLAHLVCELYLRLEAVGLAANGTYRFPLTQSELADFLGLSLVHTNRTVRDLRATNWLVWDHADIQIVEYGRLAAFANFDPAYLYLGVDPR